MKNKKFIKMVKKLFKGSFKTWAKAKRKSIWQGTKNFGNAFRRESKETVKATKILGKLLMKKEPTQDEINFLKSQSVDIGKAVALLGLQFIPGSSLGIIVLEKSLKKYGLTIFPKSQEEQSEPPVL